MSDLERASRTLEELAAVSQMDIILDILKGAGRGLGDDLYKFSGSSTRFVEIMKTLERNRYLTHVRTTYTDDCDENLIPHLTEHIYRIV